MAERPTYLKSCCLWLAAMALTSIAAAQPYVSRLGRFQVDQKKGCAPLTINLTNLLAGDCTPGKPCVMDYEGNNNQQQNVFTYTYTKPGTYKLTVLYQSIGADDITITVDQNTPPNFEIYACAGAMATIKVTDNAYDQYVIDFNNDGTPEYILPFSNNILTPSHSYTPAGTYTTSVRGRRLGSADNCTPKTQPFTTMASLPIPKINTLTSVDAANVKLDFTISANVLYRLEIATNSSSSFQLYQTLYGVNTLNIANLKLDDNYYCFRLGAFDPCNNNSTYSNTICTNKLTVTAQSDVNQVVSQTSALGTVISFSILRNQNNYLTTPSTTLNDTDITCKLKYCYQVITNYNNGSKSTSLEKCVTSFSNKIPTAISDVGAVVSPGSVQLNWVQDPKFTPVNTQVLRSSNGGNLGFYQSTTGTTFTDDQYNEGGKYCYQINYQDKCDNFSPPGTVTCPTRLEGTLEPSNVITLKWSAYKGWQSGVKNYLVQKYSLSGSLIKSFTVTDTTLIDDQPDPQNQLVRYTIKPIPVTPNAPAALSNLIEFIKNANLYYPTAFTPNGDNLNDGFTVAGQFIARMNLKIFDRWGSLIFTTEKNEMWDGTTSGRPAPASSYVWKVEITDLAGRTYSKEGMVALIRK
ncbi:MAG: gliding motility-associated C-terminal domain-containing protein [Bacteroidetes bacterium]|nr:gliding motility-associated C-terminal domain-containing protein [Bacteroidota bacterium]